MRSEDRAFIIIEKEYELEKEEIKKEYELEKRKLRYNCILTCGGLIILAMAILIIYWTV